MQAVFTHQAAQLLAVDHYALLPQHRSNPWVAVALELVADRADPGHQIVTMQRKRSAVVEGRARKPLQLAPPW